MSVDRHRFVAFANSLLDHEIVIIDSLKLHPPNASFQPQPRCATFVSRSRQTARQSVQESFHSRRRLERSGRQSSVKRCYGAAETHSHPLTATIKHTNHGIVQTPQGGLGLGLGFSALYQTTKCDSYPCGRYMRQFHCRTRTSHRPNLIRLSRANFWPRQRTM